jgi:hypothetical protein
MGASFRSTDEFRSGVIARDFVSECGAGLNSAQCLQLELRAETTLNAGSIGFCVVIHTSKTSRRYL